MTTNWTTHLRSVFSEEKFRICTDFIDQLSNRDFIEAMAIGGSVCYKPTDKYSDVDIISVITDGAERRAVDSLDRYMKTNHGNMFLCQHQTLPWFGNVRTMYFRNPLFFSIDFGYIERRDFHDFFLEPTALIIKDSDQLLASRLSSVHVADVTNRLVVQYLDKAFGQSLKIRKSLHRGHLLNALGYFPDLVRAYMLLYRVANRIEMSRPIYGKPDRDAEDIYPQEFVNECRQLYPPSYSDTPSLAKCFLSLLLKMLRLAKDCGYSEHSARIREIYNTSRQEFNR